MPMGEISVLLRLLNGRRFQSGMYASAASVRSMAGSLEEASRASSGLEAAGRTAEGALYGISAASRFVTYGLGAAAGAATYFGIQFNATMESNQLAFEHFAGGADQAKMLTQDLFDIAKTTPFAFQDITTAGRKFLAYGFDVKETTDLLRILGDTLSYTGGGADEVARLTKAMGEIKGKGRLMQQELNQLTNIGFNPYEVMAKGGLELTPEQRKNVGRAGISGDEALDALQKGLKETFGGGSLKYMETFNGQLQRLQDNLKAGAGAATVGPFAWLKDMLKTVNDQLEIAKDYFDSPAWAKLSATIGGVAGDAFNFLKDRVKEFLDAIGPMAPFLKNILGPLLKGILIGVIGGIIAGWEIFIFTLKLVSNVLGFLGDKLSFLRKPMEYLGIALGFIFGPAILRGIAFVAKILGGLFRIVQFGATLAAGPMRIFGYVASELALTLKDIGYFLGRLGGPIGMVARFIGMLGATIKNWLVAGFTAAVDAIAVFANRIGGLGPRVLELGAKLGDWLFTGLKDMLAKLFIGGGALVATIGRGLADWLNNNTPFGDNISLGPVGNIHIPALAGGGDIIGGGYAVVGERGPELVRLPTGSSVIPNRAASVRSSRTSTMTPVRSRFERGDKRTIHTHVHLKNREIAEAVSDYEEDLEARD